MLTSHSGANININFGSASDGTTNGTKMNYIYHDFFVNDSTNMVGYKKIILNSIILDNHWSGKWWYKWLYDYWWYRNW